MEIGTYDELERCEQLVAKFVGKEAAMVIGMAQAGPLVSLNLVLVLYSLPAWVLAC